MTWFGIALVIYWVVNAAMAIDWASQRRTITYTPGLAVGLLAIYALLIWGAVTVGTVQP